VLSDISSLGVTAEALLVNFSVKSVISLSRGAADPVASIRGRPHQLFFFLKKTTVRDNWYGVKSGVISLTFFLNARILQTSGRTGGLTLHAAP